MPDCVLYFKIKSCSIQNFRCQIRFYAEKIKSCFIHRDIKKNLLKNSCKILS